MDESNSGGAAPRKPKGHLWSAPTLHNTLSAPSSSSADEQADGQADAPGYLMVLQRDSAFVFTLPRAGVVLIGRAVEVGLQIVDYLASRRHAQLVIEDGRATIFDLGSQNGTAVNDQRIDAPHLLHPGDVISIANTTIIYHARGRARGGRRMIDKADFRARLGEELLRAVNFGRDLCVVAVRLPAADHRAIEPVLMKQLRAIDTAAPEPDGVLLLLMPEADAEDGRELARGVHAALSRVDPGCRMGFACCPRDGAQIETMIAAARAAVDTAAPGLVIDATDAYRMIHTGDVEIVAADLATLRVYGIAERVAASDIPVLVCGETGTGKELVARAIHHWSPRASGRLVALNCAALQDSLIESELFGHERGAFTGAHATKVGLLEAANGGSVFLDEVAELSLVAQAKLLRALESQRIMRVGGISEISIDVRMIAATHRELKDAVSEGRFREDLFFRLGGARLWLPPLRDRPRELAILARKFLTDACVRQGRAPLVITGDAMRDLAARSWPGNIRQLRNAMEYAASVISGSTLESWHVGDLLEQEPPPRAGAGAAPQRPAPGEDDTPRFRPLQEEIRELEVRRISEAMRASGGNKTQAARLIKMPLRTFLNKLKRYGITQERA